MKDGKMRHFKCGKMRHFESGITRLPPLDIFLCRNLQFLTMVGWENRHKETYSANSAENQIIIPLFVFCRATIDHYKSKILLQF
jgi:hypothetical protein